MFIIDSLLGEEEKDKEDQVRGEEEKEEKG